MLILSIIKDICQKQELCSNKCPFYDDAVNVGACLLLYNACDWDLERIEKALDDTHILDEFYRSLNKKKIVDVMGVKDHETK